MDRVDHQVHQEKGRVLRIRREGWIKVLGGRVLGQGGVWIRERVVRVERVEEVEQEELVESEEDMEEEMGKVTERTLL